MHEKSQHILFYVMESKYSLSTLRYPPAQTYYVWTIFSICHSRL